MKKIKYTPEDILSHNAIASIIKNDEGEILMQEHTKYGFWTIPLGKVKEGQSIEDGLKQEVFEECNLIIKECIKLKSKKYIYKRNNNKVNVHLHLFEIVKYTGKLNNNEPDKHKEQIFLSLKEIKKLQYLSDSTVFYLKYLGFARKPHLK